MGSLLWQRSECSSTPQQVWDPLNLLHTQLDPYVVISLFPCIAAAFCRFKEES